MRIGTADFDRCCRFPAPRSTVVHDLPDAPPRRAFPRVQKTTPTTTGAITLAVIAADLDANQLTALALVLLVLKINDFQRRDR